MGTVPFDSEFAYWIGSVTQMTFLTLPLLPSKDKTSSVTP